jgi:hypothetical protein
MCMSICFLDFHEAGLCCYLVVHIENLLRPSHYFHLWPIYWLFLVYVHIIRYLGEGILFILRIPVHICPSWSISFLD